MIIYYGETPKFTNIDKAMFSRGNYECRMILQNRRNKPVAILQSKDGDFPIWKIESDFFCVVFPSYETAFAFCRERYQSMDEEEV